MKRSVVARGREEMTRWSTEGVWGNENALCDMITDACQCTFGQIQSLCDSRVNPKVNNGL